MFVLDAIKQHAAAGRKALVHREQSLTFAALDARSEAFATWLLKHFQGDRTPVVIYGHKQLDFLPCIYGALKAGRAYVPVDVSTPPERVAEIVADIAPKVVVDFSGRLSRGLSAAVLGAAELQTLLRTPPAAGIPREQWVREEDIAYILFTSGSTGKPKGVPITARNLESFYRGLLPWLAQRERGVILNQISYSFDVSGCSLYVGLACGMTLFTVDKAMVENMGELLAQLGQSELVIWASTPSFAEICMRSARFTAALLPRMRQFLFCGEVLTHKLCDGLAERFPEADILNTYGPTEATVLVTAVHVTAEMRADTRPIPIGSPIAGTALRLVDHTGSTLDGDEQEGELHILGDSVGPGYLARPALAAQRFFEDEATGKRGYRTGDIGYRKNGLYYYCGRADNQIKLGGYRIEIEDIESNLATLPNIARAAVIPVWEGQRVQYLAAFLLLEQADGLTALGRTVALKKQAAAVLPAYMIPRKFTVVDAFPLNTNGKIDRKALADRLGEAARP